MLETITEISYIDNQTMINVQPDNINIPWPCGTWHREPIKKWLDEGNTIKPYIEPPKTQEQLLEEIEEAVQNMLDNKARALGYDSIHTAVTYADEPLIDKFYREGKALRAWRSAVWGKCYELIQAGIPMSAEDVLAELPVYGI